ncbi:MAG: Hsp20/alpha crystallin family protein [Halobacteriota archaeon]
MQLTMPTRRTGTDLSNTLAPWFRDDRVSIVERDDEYVLNFELPGFEPEEIQLRFDDGILRIFAEHVEEDGYVSRYRQTVALHDELEADDIRAEYKNGMLVVSCPIEKLLYERGEEIEITS